MHIPHNAIPITDGPQNVRDFGAFVFRVLGECSATFDAALSAAVCRGFDPTDVVAVVTEDGLTVMDRVYVAGLYPDEPEISLDLQREPEPGKQWVFFSFGELWALTDRPYALAGGAA